MSSIGAYPKAPQVGQESVQGIDLYGALVRRKFLVLLLAIVGSGFGYLYYSKQPDVFESSLRLQILEKTPTAIGDNDSILRQQTAPKHKNLILSEVVLKSAIENGRLKSLAMFRDDPFPTYTLKKSVTIFSEKGDDETILISCSGPNTDDLPTVLNQIVQSYKDILDQDSRDSNRDIVDLIQKFHDSGVQEMKDAQTRYLELSRKHGLTSRLANGDFANQFVPVLFESRNERDSELRRHEEVVRLLIDLRETMEEKVEPKIAVLAIEAQKYIGSTNTLPLINNSTYRREYQLTNNYTTQIARIQTRLHELDAAKQSLQRVFASGSYKIRTLDASIATWKAELEKVERAQADLVAAPTNVGDEEKKIREDQEAYWITLYSIALINEQEKLAASLENLNKKVNENQQNANSIAGDIHELNFLRRDIAEKREAAAIILEQIKGINLVSNDYTTYKVRVIDSAGAGIKIAPSFPRSLGMGVMLGAMVGMGLALLVDRMDMNFRNPNEILERLGVPVVGRVPRIRTQSISKDVKGSQTLVASHKPSSSSAEAFRAVRTAMFFAASNAKANTFLFTSPSPGDGKSTVCSNLAISIAQTGKRVLLLDADFRRPRICQYFGEETEPGIMSVLNGEKSLRECIRPSMQENLFLLPAGGRPKNPGEIVTSPDFDKILEEVRKEFDFILIDSPPVLPVADPTVLASKVDGVYLVIRIRKGVRVSAQNAKDNLDRVNANTIGIIVNGLDENPHYNEYGYSYYYPYNAGYQRYYDAEQSGKGRSKAISG